MLHIAPKSKLPRTLRHYIRALSEYNDTSIISEKKVFYRGAIKTKTHFSGEGLSKMNYKNLYRG